ncbi:beta-lactamase-like protein [Lipomyces kononenkoae]|uniref:Beta-lactamase-like protein n=1 Tax=Lipomyces kononenkoae TaxID=34357 RepID=A0ACC3TBE5_LIPKO
MFTFTPLLGASSSVAATLASQSLLSFDQNVRVLIDVGWNDKFDLKLLAELERITPSIDLILLTHATISHLGAYVYACRRFPGFDAIPVYATLPVINMGRMVTIDAYSTAWFTFSATEASSRSPQEEPIQLSDIDAIFDKIHALKYSQQLTLTAKLSSLRLTAHNAGHTLGGTLWRLQYGQEDIVYAVDWNHAVERHLNSSALLTAPEQLSRPTALICGARTGSGIRRREDLLLSAILRGVERGGSVFMPTSTSARALELCHLLDSIWVERKYTVPLMYFSRAGARTMAYARSMLEWMSPAIVREWEEKGTSPFVFKSLKIATSEDEVRGITGPKVILASGQGLEWGVSRELFASLSDDPNNIAIFTQRADCETFAGEILTLWQAATEAMVADDDGVSGPKYGGINLQRQLEIRKSVPLQGEELETYLAEEKARKNLVDRQTAMDLKNRTILDQPESESESSESEEDIDDDYGEDMEAEKSDLGILALTQDNDLYDFEVRGVKSIKHKMFPYVPRRIRRDPYGEIIRVEDYVRAEERDETVTNDSNDNVQEAYGTIGKKRKWTDEREEEKRTVIPSKTVLEHVDIVIRCEVTYIEYEGLADSRSMQMIIPQIQPRKLILIADTIEHADNLATSLRDAGIQDIYVPTSGKSVNASMDANAYVVTLSDDLAHQLIWQDTVSGEYTVAQLKGRLLMKNSSNESSQTSEHIETSDLKDVTLGHLATRKDLAIASAQTKPVFVGDIRLAELRRRLMTEGVHAEFKGEGVLLCDGHILVRKLENGKVLIHGGVGVKFYEIRKIVDSFLARIV